MELDKADRLRFELVGIVLAFLESKSMNALAKADMDFEWWFRRLEEKAAEIAAATR